MSGPARFNKFASMKALQSDATLTECALRIGIAICISFTRGTDGTGWEFDLDQLTAELGGRTFAQKTINAAVAQLVSRGYVAQTYRSKGGHGCRWRASFDLLPIRSDGRVPDANPDVQTDGYRTNPSVQTDKPIRLDGQTHPFGRTENRPDQQEEPPTGTSSGTSSGGSAREDEPTPPDPFDYQDKPPEDHHPDPFAEAAAATAAPPTHAELERAAGLPPHPSQFPAAFDEPEPSRYCPKHPDDTDDVCRPCQRRREGHPAARAAWARRRDEFRSGRTKAREQWIEKCCECDEGWTLGPDGSVLDDGTKCVHPRLWRAYWASRGQRPPTAAPKAAS